MIKMDVSFNSFDFQSDKAEGKNPEKSTNITSYQSLESKKFNLEDIYIFETSKKLFMQ